MRGGSLAKRYATALISVARERGDLEQVRQDLMSLVEQVQGNEELKLALESPVITPSQKKALFARIQEKLGLSPPVENLTKILIDQDRVAILSILGQVFRDMADEELGQVRVQVKVPAPLGDKEGKLRAILEKSLGRKIILDTLVEPELLGGLVVKVQDRVFDASLKNDLEKIKESIVKKAVA